MSDDDGHSSLSTVKWKVKRTLSLSPPVAFDTFKISSDMNINMKSVVKMNMEFSAVSYRSPKVLWDIKTENYRKGKLIGTTVLSKIL